MTHERNFVRLGRLLFERRIGAALGALQVLKNDEGNVGAFRRAKKRGILSERERAQNQ